MNVRFRLRGHGIGLKEFDVDPGENIDQKHDRWL